MDSPLLTGLAGLAHVVAGVGHTPQLPLPDLLIPLNVLLHNLLRIMIKILMIMIMMVTWYSTGMKLSTRSISRLSSLVSCLTLSSRPSISRCCSA